MPMDFDKGMERIGTEFAELNPNESFDWVSMAGILSEVLIPLIQDCMEKRRSAAAASRMANRTRRFGLLESTQLRLALRKHPYFDGNEEAIGKVVLALKNSAQKSKPTELREFFESVGE